MERNSSSPFSLLLAPGYRATERDLMQLVNISTGLTVGLGKILHGTIVVFHLSPLVDLLSLNNDSYELRPCDELNAFDESAYDWNC